MAFYGRQTVGGSFIEFESRRRARKITLTGSETLVKVYAYIKTQGTACNGTLCCLLNTSDESIAFQSTELAGFTDTSGAWREYTFSGTITAGDYWVVIAAQGISGGGNTVLIATDTVASDTSLYKTYFFSNTWPTQQAFAGNDASDATQDISIYLETSGGGSSVTKTPTTGNLSLGGLAVLTNAFQNVRIREVFINESGQAVASASNIRLMVWYGGQIRGQADVSLNGMTTDPNGTISWSIPTGTLVNGNAIFYVAQDSISFSNYTAARMIPSYE